MTDKLAGFITQPDPNTRRILVVDDEVEILEIMQEFLQQSFPESHIVSADDGQEALNLALENQYDIICTDHRMPIMSGAEFVNTIREDERSLNKNTPILFVTSFIDDAKKSIKYRDNIFFLNKPFDSTNLVLYVDSVMLRAALDVAGQRKKLMELEKEFYAKQTRIIQRARVASYSEFSLGIAHELNNPLAVIEGLAYILEQDPSKAKSYSKKIIDNVARMKVIINHLRSFSNLDHPENLSNLDVNDLLKSLPTMFFERMKKTNITFEFSAADEQIWVAANKKQLERVFQILVLNSIEAYERDLTIENRSIKITSRLDEKNQKQVLISFEDRAGGIPEKLKSKIFDPFTTSKQEVTGVGFGLSIAWAVVVGLGGEIHIEDANGGANFLIRLPAQDKDSTHDKVPVKKRNLKQELVSHGSKKLTKPLVLIVDDEVAICELLKCYLEESFEVHHTSSANLALKMAVKQEYDLVISDFKMPEMDGIILINNLVAHSPETKFILISGHIMSIETLGFTGDINNLGFISKPFGDPDVIIEYINDLLA